MQRVRKLPLQRDLSNKFPKWNFDFLPERFSNTCIRYIKKEERKVCPRSSLLKIRKGDRLKLKRIFSLHLQKFSFFYRFCSRRKRKILNPRERKIRHRNKYFLDYFFFFFSFLFAKGKDTGIFQISSLIIWLDGS